jgi:hypothetical protein
MQPTGFSQNVKEKLGYYVYLYLDPRDGSIFYVGKGTGDRAFAHLYDLSESAKVQRIAAIRAANLQPEIEILVHGLQDEETALRIEASIIDLIGIDKLTNQVRGYESTALGRQSVALLVAQYDRTPVQIEHRVLLIRINQLYRYGMSELALYEATRGVWKAGGRRGQAEFAFAVFRGIVREVYRISAWHPAGTTPYMTRPPEHLVAPGRWEFVGERASEEIRARYIDKSVEQYLAGSSRNPIRYVNC